VAGAEDRELADGDFQLLERFVEIAGFEVADPQIGRAQRQSDTITEEWAGLRLTCIWHAPRIPVSRGEAVGRHDFKQRNVYVSFR
jgi:hypothetical protein